MWNKGVKVVYLRCIKFEKMWSKIANLCLSTVCVSKLNLIYPIAFAMVALLAAIYLPPLQQLLSTQGLALSDWLLLLAIVTSEIVLVEIVKYFFISRHLT